MVLENHFVFCSQRRPPKGLWGSLRGQMAALAWKAFSGLELASRQLKRAKEHAELRPGKGKAETGRYKKRLALE
jgi:hypothetical protein